MYRDIDAIMFANKAIGRHFFDADTMRFFRSRVLDTVYGGRYFVTSDAAPNGPRRYTVRECVDGKCHTAEGRTFQEYATAEAAKSSACLMAVEARHAERAG
jgi:hypothetical protein